jgi:hypothetical protein
MFKSSCCPLAIMAAVACSNLSLLNPSKDSSRARFAIRAPLYIADRHAA